MFASSGAELKIHAWNGSCVEELSSFSPPSESKITNVSWCNDNSYVALLQENERAQIISTKDPSQVYLIHNISAVKNISAITFKNNTKRNLAIGNKSGDVLIYDTKMRVLSKHFPKLSSTADYLEFSSSDEQLGVLSKKSLIVHYDIQNDGDYNVVLIQPSDCSLMTFHPVHQQKVAVGCKSGYFAIWDTISSKVLNSYEKHCASITGLNISASGKLLITGGLDYKICVTDASSGDCPFRMTLPEPITSTNLSADDKFIIAGLEDGTIYVYDIRCHLDPMILSKVHETPITKVVFENAPRETNLDYMDIGSVASTTSVYASDITKESKLQVPILEMPMDEMDVIHQNANSLGSSKNETLDKIKKESLKMVRNHMDELENQLASHYSKFQSFINNEFESIHSAIRERWDIFNVKDMTEVIHTVNSDAKTAKSNSVHK